MRNKMISVDTLLICMMLYIHCNANQCIYTRRDFKKPYEITIASASSKIKLFFQQRLCGNDADIHRFDLFCFRNEIRKCCSRDRLKNA